MEITGALRGNLKALVFGAWCLVLDIWLNDQKSLDSEKEGSYTKL